MPTASPESMIVIIGTVGGGRGFGGLGVGPSAPGRLRGGVVLNSASRLPGTIVVDVVENLFFAFSYRS
jgi:hypothetical protein